MLQRSAAARPRQFFAAVCIAVVRITAGKIDFAAFATCDECIVAGHGWSQKMEQCGKFKNVKCPEKGAAVPEIQSAQQNSRKPEPSCHMVRGDDGKPMHIVWKVHSHRLGMGLVTYDESSPPVIATMIKARVHGAPYEAATCPLLREGLALKAINGRAVANSPFPREVGPWQPVIPAAEAVALLSSHRVRRPMWLVFTAEPVDQPTSDDPTATMVVGKTRHDRSPNPTSNGRLLPNLLLGQQPPEPKQLIYEMDGEAATLRVKQPASGGAQQRTALDETVAWMRELHDPWEVRRQQLLGLLPAADNELSQAARMLTQSPQHNWQDGALQLQHESRSQNPIVRTPAEVMHVRGGADAIQENSQYREALMFLASSKQGNVDSGATATVVEQRLEHSDTKLKSDTVSERPAVSIEPTVSKEDDPGSVVVAGRAGTIGWLLPLALALWWRNSHKTGRLG